ncbi:hypothetical protein B0H17DRAFT_927849 [Mycena rosella]|uniref:Peptidase C14 caspase domain-containing protein n=1 Tax=Mycena rosella TaxID=1033263 RepID=A0AAD7DTX8_MYCRO|nr:hypothetical protein B0H17DRAFT_927849 [Mycena rosella]
MGQRIFALLIGINQYQSENVGNLQGCVRDAESMRDVLLEHSPNAQISLLTDGSATRMEILKAFKQHLFENPLITKTDAIIVYFAGKGQRLPGPAGTPGRDVDILLPQDYSDETHGISDSTLHTLLCDLAKEKGPNIVCFLMLYSGYFRSHRSA